MSTLRRARIVRGAAPATAEPVAAERRADARPRRLPREAVDANLLAKATVERARAEARAIVAAAKDEAAGIAAAAAEEAKAAATAKLAGGLLALRALEERRAERDLDRAVELARVLAERLLGEALAADPTRVVALARQALLEARGAKSIVIEAGPLDAETLRHHAVSVGVPEGTLTISIDPNLPRGSLRVHTNLGSLDAKLRTQLERLAGALRDALA